MTENQNAIVVKNVYKTFKLPHEQHSGIKQRIVNVFNFQRGYEVQNALSDVSFEIKEGEFFGIVGRNGSGKSTLLKLIAGIYVPDKGAVQVNGSLTPFIELGVGFNPELTGRENVFLNGALLGFDRNQMEAMYKDIVEFAEIEKFMDQKLKNYSSGMQVRLAFSIAIRAKTDILLLDEVLAVGDYEFQEKCFEYFKYLRKIKKTVILVSHDMNNIKRFCTAGLHIKNGKIIKKGNVLEVIASYNQENIERAVAGKESDSNKRISGTGEAIIKGVYTQNDKGVRKGVYKPYEKIHISFVIKALKDLESPTLGMVFSDNSGRVVFATNTLDKTIKTPTIKKFQTVTVNYILDNIFDDSIYIVSGAIANSDRTTVYARVESACEFRSIGWTNTAKSSYYPEHTIELNIK